MALTETRPAPAQPDLPDAPSEPRAPTGLELLLGTGDHRSLGRVYSAVALVMLALSAALLSLAGIDALSDDGLLGLTTSLATSSTAALVLTGALPLLLGVAMQIVPAQVGSRVIAFPRAAAPLSLWTWLMGSVIFYIGVALDGGIGGPDLEGARLTSLSMGTMMVALSIGATCVAVTVLSHRPFGMGLAKVPLFSWSMLVAAPVWILSFGSATAHVFLGQVSQANAVGLAEVYVNGISWLFRAPAVYMLAIPVLGIAADVVAKTSGRRIARYGLVQGTIGAYAIFSFGAWAQTPGSVQNFVWVGFVVTAALPVLVLLGGLLDTVRRGRFTASAELIGSLLALLLVIGGVVSAALLALDTTGPRALFGFDVSALEEAQTYFLVGAAVLGGLAALAFWSRPLFGAAAPEPAFKAAITTVLLGAGLLGTVNLVQGAAAADGRDGLPSEVLAAAIALGAGLLLIGTVAGFAATAGAAKSGADDQDSTDDEGLTLEWSATPDDQADLAYVTSPYPLLDLRQGDDEEETS